MYLESVRLRSEEVLLLLRELLMRLLQLLHRG